jgi:hypothetical protein
MRARTIALLVTCALSRVSHANDQRVNIDPNKGNRYSIEQEI